MRTVAVIPARFGSTRLPAKALLRETGKYLVQHVYESVQACAVLDRVLVATDDDRIVQAVESFGGDVLLTSPDHQSGTDRVAEAAARLSLADDDLVLNVQGDEPEVAPAVIGAIVGALSRDATACPIATAATPFPDQGPREGPGSPLDPNRVKVVLDEAKRALYFSRSLIPHPRDTHGRVDRPSRWLLHLGIYAFRCRALREVTERRSNQSASTLDQVESLEQLRWLAAGYRMAVAVVDHTFVGIDTAEDYAAFVRRVGACATNTS